MKHSRLPLLLPLLALAACGEDQSPTAPTPAGPAGPVFSTAAGQRVVNSLADPGDGVCDASQCTLREAIADPGSTDISFASGLTGAITLARSGAGGGSLVIGKGLTISAPSAGITIRRRSTDPAFRILRIDPGATVKLANLSVRNGKTDGPGGGILNYGTLTLTHCTVAGNASTQHGGGIDNHGPLTVTNTDVVNNSAARGGGVDNHNNITLRLAKSTVARNGGGGISNNGGTLEITNSAVSYNPGGGIAQERGTATLEKVRIVGNSAPGGGGGIALHQGTITLTNSTIARNSAPNGGGILNSAGGNLTIAKSTISNNAATGRGGGIFNTVGDPFGRLSARLTLTNSTVSGNSAGSGAGIENSDELGGASLTVRNSTVASNSAEAAGGGIHQEDGFENSNPVFLTNSLVAHNTAPTGPDVLGGPGATFSMIGDGTGSGLTNTNGNQVGNVSPNGSAIDPKLGPLADNGGPTLTHALLLGSPAIDAASAANCPSTDQRGVPRPQGAACDIGSYERK